MNPLDAGDECIVCVNGAFSERMAIIAERIPAKVIRVEAPYGRTVDPADVLRAGKGRKIKFVGLTHGETSSGVVQRIEDYRKVADELGALLVVDAVASLAGVPLDVDAQRIDICFSGSQKAISAPPGMAPITVGPRAEEAMHARKEPVRSWYFDLTTAMNYWGKDRLYHHTPPITLIYALREALRAVLEEGLEARWERHRENQQALIAGLEAMGLEMFVSNPADRLVTVTAINIPAGIEDGKVRAQLLDEFNIEIAGGPRAGEGQNLARGADGLFVPEAERTAVPRVARKDAARSRIPAAGGRGVAAAIQNYQHATQPAVAGARK